MMRLRLYWRLLRLGAVVLAGLLVATALGLGERCALHVSFERKQWLTRWLMARLAAALPFRVRVIGELPSQPMLWVANHVSWCDIPLLGVLRPLSFLAKSEVSAWPVLGWLARQAGTLFIRRGGGNAALINQELAGHLQRGRHLLIFPEGTSTDGSSMRTFHPRLFACAIEAGCAIQPVAIRYLRDGKPDTLAPFIGDDELPMHVRRLLASNVAEVDIHLLAPIPVASLSRKALAEQAQQAIEQVLFSQSQEPTREAA
ncbi:1-acyl-sn-glycerol-3-phosphate acyltransferase [Pseudomonas stutzeri]|uniref:1-acyl-sn-glycerol-3-phosphate acyltransferase n=1 Tax=Stutzerimonas stutzeri TaxID=316 RepID=A0A2N8S212_STUST|nr:lysophospholipid acyltransferase family protein [Stutzerimonas stutzeri]MCQ4295805.1 1-acyl-sn-glycerol-3-phosphate acyltransferase [Stutzerimonas stutzeri]PNF80642.1 1-acyl-sn-glycerol-3-phosphate acyltransferase [Stutzerimonas stutzeri]